ncbi:hypothetical protein JAAARDRAFT_221638 [Jaapia argillacea MUCL 33604]|uniref:Fido domain-containing protein n=1 Tax=Jaapia argillacea MUCL 33604 TaxID=933084 RepID=A0A067QBC7_9AGAM|nr:hypothetical protein JAAARDRAFT_221638 [Jaapia argillacea MUCL 33604]
MISSIQDNLTLLTPQTIKDIHETLMNHSRILVVSAGQNPSLKYTNGGQTRTALQKTVLLDGPYKIGFCPFAEVDRELNYICGQARQWIRNFPRNPFAVGAWFHLILIRCHPFEDGNGRLARMLGSIPLLRAGYPPLCVLLKWRHDYYGGLKAGYDGNLAPLADSFAQTLQLALQEVQGLTGAVI